MREHSPGSDEYNAIAEELSDPDTKITDLNPEAVSIAIAKAYAKRQHKRWPPSPINTGIPMSIRTGE
jgi:hypothetical protein